MAEVVEGGSSKREGFVMTIACPPQKKVPKRKKEEEEIETLTLSHFTKAPRVDFDVVKLGASSTRTLRVHNPEDIIQHVDIEKFPHKKGFSVEEMSFEVDGYSDLLLKLTWTPEESGNCREMILFKVDGIYRLQAYVFGRVEEPKTKQKKRKTWLTTKQAPTVQPRMAVQACLQGKENCPPRRRVSPSPTLVEKPAFSPPTTPTKESKRRKVWQDVEQPKILAMKPETPSPEKDKAVRPPHRALQFTPTCASRSPHTPKYFPPLTESVEGSSKVGHVDDHEFPMVTATPEIIEARLPRRQRSVPIKRDTIVLDKEDDRSSPDDIRRETVVLSQGMPQGPISRETIVIPRSNLSPGQQPCVSPRVARLRLEGSPTRNQKKASKTCEVITKETTELIELFHLQRVEEEEVVIETVTTVETNVDGEVTYNIIGDTHVTTEVKGDWVQSGSTTTYKSTSHKSSKEEVESHLYVEEVHESVIEMQEDDSSENSVNISPPRTISKTDVKRQATNAVAETPERFKIVLDKPLQRGSFSSTPIVSTQVLGRDSFDKMTDTKPVSPVTLDMLTGPEDPNLRRISSQTVTKSQPSQVVKEENVELKRNLFGPHNADGDDIAPLTDISAGWQQHGTNAKNPFEERSTTEVESRRFSNITVTKPSAVVSHLPGHFELVDQLEDSIFMPPKSEEQQLGTTFRKSPSKFPTAGVSALLAKAKRSPVRVQQSYNKEPEPVFESPAQKKRTSETFFVFTAASDCVTPARGIPSVDSSSVQRSLKRTAKSKKHRRSITHTIDENEANLSLLERPTVEHELKSEECEQNTQSTASPEGQDLHMSELGLSLPPRDLVLPETAEPASPTMPAPVRSGSESPEPNFGDPTSSLFQESEVRVLSLADLTASSKMEEKEPAKKRSPRRSWGRVTKTLSPVKARSPTKAGRQLRADRQYDRPWATGPQKKFARSAMTKKEGEKKLDKSTAKLSRSTKVDRAAVQATVNSSSLSANRSVRLSSRRSVGLAQTKLQLVRPRAMSLAALPKHPLAHAAKNMYYDERWMEKEERGFICWLNFILTPPDEHFEAVKPKKIDAGSISLDRPSTVQLAPSKETLSLRAYTIRKNLNILRSRACRLLQSEELARVHHKLEIEIECGRLAIRPDRKVHADLGLKQGILDMLLCYNPLWLRIGLEGVYGEVVPVSSNTDVYGLSRFILTRLLQNPDIAQQYSHPTVPHLYRPGYDKATSQFMLKKFLLLVILLDHAKRQRLIKWDPCLFCKDAEFKSSRDLLINFAKDYLSGEGDITKHLSYMGYHVSYTQRFIEEYNYAVANLATDLRDGVKLTRIAELLTKDETLMNDMRVPAISRLQKIHNTEVAFRGLVAQGVQMSSNRGDITPRDIVDGQREKTLQLLWKVIFNFQVSLVLSEEMLKDEIRFLRENWRFKSQLADFLQDTPALGLQRDGKDMEPELYFEDPKLQLLLQWCKAVSAYYGVKVENFTVSFSDGRVLCLLLHHYHPSLLRYEEIRQTTSQTQDASTDEVDDEADLVTDMIDPTVMESLTANEKANFKLLFNKVSELGGVPMMLKTSDMCNTIPDEKVVITYVSYLCCRLLDIRHETRAARVIQAAYRRHLLKKHAALYQMKIQAVVKIQRFVRMQLARRLAAKRLRATVKIQCWWRHCRAKKYVKKLKEEKQEKARREMRLKAAVKIQRCVRSHLTRRHRAVVSIQCWWRRHLAQKQVVLLKEQREVQVVKERKAAAAVKIQRNVLLWMTRCLIRKRRNAAITLQCWWRRCLAEQKLVRLIREREVKEMHQAASKIQEWWRAKCVMDQQRWNYRQMRCATVKIQAWYRANKARHHFHDIRRASITIQQWYRSVKVARQEHSNYLRIKASVFILQSYFRAWQQRRKFIQLQKAVRIIQRNYQVYRMTTALKSWAEEYRRHKAATVLQSWYRSRVQQRRFSQMRNAAIVIQRGFREYQTHVWNQLRRTAAALIIQTHWRRHTCRKSYLMKQNAAVLIQRQFRRYSCVIRYRALKLAVHYVERWYQAVLLGRKAKETYLAQKTAAMKMQAIWRGYKAQKTYRDQRRAACVIQQWYRACIRHRQVTQAALLIQSVWRARQLGRQCHEEYSRQRKAAISLQKLWRARQVSKTCRRSYVEMKCAVMSLQTYWRARQLGNQCREEFLKLKCAAVSLQRLWRARQLGKQCHQEFQGQKCAALSLQRHWRARQLGKQCREEFQRQKCASLSLQRHWRARKLGKQCHEEFRRQKCAALSLQRHWRARQLGKQCREEFRRQKCAALSLQRHWRARQLGKQCHQEFQRQKCAALSLQRHWRARQLGKQCREEFWRQKCAAVSLQRLWRARQLGKQCHQEFQRRKCAALSLQRHWRARQLGKQCHQEFQRWKCAALSLQRHWRARQLGKLCREEFQGRKCAALSLQRHWRARQLGNQCREEFNIQKCAALSLQRLWRARQLGKQCCKEFMMQKCAAITLQRYWRARQLGKQCRNKFLKEKCAASSLQRHWRARQLGKQCHKQFMRRKAAATLLQRHWRARQDGKHCRQEFLRQKCAAVSLQRQWRARQLGKQCQQEFVRQKCAAVSLQRCWRARQLGKQHREEFRRLKCAVLSLQKHWRARQLGMQCREEFTRQKCATLSIQRHWRARQFGKQCREEYKRQQAAVMLLQMHWRARQLGKQFHDEFKRQKCAASLLQTYWRARQLGKQTHEQFSKEITAALSLQRHWRARQLGKQCHEEFMRQKYAALSLQKHWYSRQAVHHCRQAYLRKKLATLLLQRHWRAVLLGRRTRSQYLAMRCAAVVLQRHFRAAKLGRQCRSAYAKLREDRNTLQRRISAAMTLQRWWRSLQVGRQCREEYARLKQAITTSQRRTWAAVTLQKHWRALLVGRVCREEYVTMKEAFRISHRRTQAVITLQRHWRALLIGRVCRKEYVQLKQNRIISQRRSWAVVTLQRRWRALLMGRQCREQYDKLKEAAIVSRRHTWAAVTLQKRWRALLVGTQCRDDYARMKEASMISQRRLRAAVTLQRRWRALLIGRHCRKEYKTLKETTILRQRTWAVITLQRHWRALLIDRQCRDQYARERDAFISRKRTSAAETLQRHWRALIVGRQCRKECAKIKEAVVLSQERTWAAVILQRRWRALLAGKRCILEYARKKEAVVASQRLTWAVVTLQRRWRAVLIGRECRKQYSKLRQAAFVVKRRTWAVTVLQRRWRAFLVGRQCRKVYSKLRQEVVAKRKLTWAAITIQRKWRVLIAGRQCREEFLKLRRAAIVTRRRTLAAVVLQRRWRALLLGRLCRMEYAKLRQAYLVSQRRAWAAGVLQRRWRALLIGRQCREEYARMLQAWKISQGFMKEQVQHHQRVVYMRRCVNAATVVQRRWRAVRVGRLCRMEYSVLIEERRKERLALEAARRVRVTNSSATKIQALWRGYVFRKNIKDAKMNEARKRIHKVTSAVREEDRLGNRTSFAIENLLKYKHVSQVLRAVTDLDASTRHSWVCCERLVASNALPILFTLINVCNRSLPHMEIISCTVNVLLNLAKYHKTVSSVFEVEGCLDTLLELLKIYREKGVIFTRTCTLIGLLCQNEARAQITRDKPGFVDKLLSIHKLCLRKHDLETKRRLNKAPNKTNPFATHRLCPQWFARRYSTNEIDDPLEAMRYLLNSIGKLPEEPPVRRPPTREICPRYPRTLVVPPKKH